MKLTKYLNFDPCIKFWLMATIRGNFKAQYYDIGFSKDICGKC